MSLVERLLQLRRHLDHLRRRRPAVTGTEALERDLWPGSRSPGSR